MTKHVVTKHVVTKARGHKAKSYKNTLSWAYATPNVQSNVGRWFERCTLLTKSYVEMLIAPRASLLVIGRSVV